VIAELLIFTAAVVSEPFEPVSLGQIGRWKELTEKRCAESPFPKECANAGWAAYASGSALSSCRLGFDQKRKKSFRYSYGDHLATQAQINEFCGDIVEACKINWTAFLKRSRPNYFQGDKPKDSLRLEERLEDRCYDKPVTRYVD